MNKIHGISISEVDNIVGLAPKTRKMTETVTALFSFCADDYHLSLVDWKDGHDGQYSNNIPGFHAIEYGGHADPSCETILNEKSAPDFATSHRPPMITSHDSVPGRNLRQDHAGLTGGREDHDR